jgi:N-hydroxyarylamine O-acetyltransferase
MFPSESQKAAYLQKIGFSGHITQDAQTLKEIVEKHIFTFPFEDIDLHDTQRVRSHHFTPQDCFKKLVVQQRGGICVELNSVLQTMLKSFGFDVTPILPDDVCENLPSEARGKHCAALVNIDGESYLVDAGYGMLGLLSPIPLKMGIYQQYSERFELKKNDQYEFVLSNLNNKKPLNLFAFNRSDVATWKDYIKVSKKTRDKNDPIFGQLLLCTKPFHSGSSHNGRYRLCNNRFTIYDNFIKTVDEKFDTHERLQELLKEYFDIDLHDHTVLFKEQDLKRAQQQKFKGSPDTAQTKVIPPASKIAREPILPLFSTRRSRKEIQVQIYSDVRCLKGKAPRL